MTFLFFSCQEQSLLSSELSDNESSPVTLAKPLPKLVGETYTPFTMTPPNFWNGTINFGDQGIYGLTFISPEFPVPHGQSSHFEEQFLIYELGSDWQIEENVYLRGHNVGVMSEANSKFRANGEVTEAYGSFAEWQGCKVHISGEVINSDTGFPVAASGLFRIN